MHPTDTEAAMAQPEEPSSTDPSSHTGEEEEEPFQLAELQKCGKYTVYISVVYFIMVLTQVCNLLFMSLAGSKPRLQDFCDARYPNITPSCHGKNCFVVVNATKIECAKEIYDFLPITYDFPAPSATVKYGTVWQNVGLMVGAMIFGNLADIYGRKKVLLAGTVGLLIFTIATSFAPSFVWFTVLRFIDMTFTGGKHCVCNPYYMENLPDKHRMWLATMVTYSPNYIVLALIGYLSHGWRTLARVAAVLTVLPLITLPFLKDTPRWLVAKGKTERAVRSAIYISKWDRKLTPESKERIEKGVEELCKIEEEKRMMKKKKNYYFWHLFMHCRLASYAIVFAISLFSTSFISYGIAYNLEAISGNVFINMAILGAARYVVNIICAVLEFNFQKIGRRVLHLTCVGIIAVLNAIIFIIYIFTYPEIQKFKHQLIVDPKAHNYKMAAIIDFTRYASLIAAAVCTEVFVLNSVQPTELFPTPVRSAGIAFIQVFNRLGTILSPIVFVPSAKWPPAPFLLMLFTSSLDFILYIFLIPETRGKKLPDVMPEKKVRDVESSKKSIWLKSTTGSTMSAKVGRPESASQSAENEKS